MLVIDENADRFYSNVRMNIAFLAMTQNQEAVSEKRDKFDDITKLHGRTQ